MIKNESHRDHPGWFPGPSAPRSSEPLSCELVRSLALECGFTEAGIVSLPHAQQDRDAARFAAWVHAGRAGTMDYLKRLAPIHEPDAASAPLLRERVAIPFPWARSAIVCFANYNAAEPRSTDPADQNAAWIARYAWSRRAEDSREDRSATRRPSDYHKVLKKHLAALEARLRESHRHEGGVDFEARGYVDTGPVVERALATAAGLGWTGKNTCLIHPRLGSYGFLAVLLTSLEVEENPQPLTVPDRCGSCTRCIEACPTGALIAPYEMDATRCISYLTIEHKGVIEEALMPGMGRQVFGCDICQDVCPWNRKAPIGTDLQLQARAELVNPVLDWLAQMDEAEFERQFNGSPVRRAGFMGFKRNVAIAIGNSGVQRFAPLLRAWTAAANQPLRAAAQWALKRLTSEYLFENQLSVAEDVSKSGADHSGPCV